MAMSKRLRMQAFRASIALVIKALAEELPMALPKRCSVVFRIINCDSQKEVVYERTKGKGF